MFLDKDQLLFQLNKLYDLGASVCASLYSHPGQGKTRLLTEFSGEKNVLYFKADNVLYQENFVLLRDLCVRQLGSAYSRAGKFAELFRMMAKNSVDSPLVLILDDYQHLASGNRRFSTILSSLLSKEGKNSRLFILTCKPASLYEKESPKEEHPFLFRNFHFFEMRSLYPSWTLEDQILLYAVTDGNPGYLEYFPEDRPLMDSLYERFFTEKGSLYRLVPSRLREIYSGSAIIRSILVSMGSQPKKLQEICDRTQLTPSAASSLLSALSTHNLVERMVPVTEDLGSRRALYRISDSVFAFWYSYVFPYRSEIENGGGKKVFLEKVQPQFDACMKAAFEHICRDFLRLQKDMSTAPFPFEQIGMWWGQHPTKKRTEYVSIAAAYEHHILLGTCFWTDEWIDIDALYDLQKHATLFPKKEQWYYLFATSDFVGGFETISGSHVHAFSLEEMCRTAEGFIYKL